MLVTALVLLAILTVLGIASAYKTVVEVKMSRVSAESVRAINAANAAVHKQFYEWAMDATTGSSDGDRTEFGTLISNVTGGTVAGIYKPTLRPANITALDSTAGGDIDNYIQTNTFFRVYNVTSTGVSQTANSNWASLSIKDPQVAIWVTSYNVPVLGGKPDPDKYPYVEPCGPSVGSTCDGDSSIAIYAVARSGESLRMVRQLISTAVDPVLEGVNAITNAPKYNSWHDACQGTSSSSTNTASWSIGSNWNTIVNATQAIYTLGDAANGIPSGTAIASNSNASNGSTGGGGSTEAELVMSETPLVAYTGHTPVEGVRVKAGGTPKETDGSLDLTATGSKLPRFLIPTQLLGTAHEISYFLDGNSHLFDLDVFRWGAEQFTCQNASSSTAANGAFCAKAEALRVAVNNAMPGVTVSHPVTGRLTLADFEYNVSNGIPMFGLVRVMYPALESENSTDVSNCTAFGSVTLHQLDTGVTTTIGSGSNAIAPHSLASNGHDVSAVKAGNGRFTTYSANSRIVVYGLLFFDFFSDQDGDGYYDPATTASSGEYLLKPMEAYGIQFDIDVPIIVNPALPRISSRGTNDPAAAFPTAAATAHPTGSTDNLSAAGLINAGSSTDPAGLASPYDGWFPATEGMLALDTGAATEGTMNLMQQSASAGLLAAMREIEGSTDKAVIGNLANGLYVGAKSRLEYYHALNKVTLSHNVDQFWPISASLPTNIQGTSSQVFCIGSQDCASDNDNPGDRLHLLFPSGYTHGWKVALAALDMTAAQWNALLTGNGVRSISDLRTSHATPAPVGDSTHPKGSPFGVQDSGYTSTNVASIQAASSSYYSVTADSTTGYGTLDSSFRDVPSLIFSGGRIYLNYHMNMSGIVYTAGALEWAPGRVGADPDNGLSYVTGAEVTGFGSYTRNKGTGSETYQDAHIAVSFDPVAVDYINTNQESVVIMRRYAWQELF